MSRSHFKRTLINLGIATVLVNTALVVPAAAENSRVSACPGDLASAPFNECHNDHEPKVKPNYQPPQINEPPLEVFNLDKGGEGAGGGGSGGGGSASGGPN